MLWHQNYTHQRAKRALRLFLGYPLLADYTYKQVCQRNGLRRSNRTADPEALADAEFHIEQALQSGQSTLYGTIYTIADIREECGSWFSRRDAARIIQRLDPVGVASRDPKKKRVRKGYHVKGWY
jgi:hypothetical protein